MMRRTFLLLLILHVICYESFATAWLFSNGKTEYEIVLPADASLSESTAAKELQSYLKQIGGADFCITQKPRTGYKQLFIGVDAPAANKKYEAGNEGFTYQEKNGNLYIWGGKEKGTMYGVYAFLENELGVRWYTPEYTQVSKKDAFIIDNINHSESPSIQKRHVLYYDTERSQQWCAHNRLNCAWTARDNKFGGQSAIYGAHTLSTLIPSEKNFKQHPEYFALNKGKRISNGQLCLTNPNVKDAVVDTLRMIMEKNREYWAFDVSQGDNRLFCECENCKAVEEMYGAHSGLILWFVNQVAEKLYEEFPDKYLCTFAYQYTRQAPKGIKPHRNVIVRLCDIECCFVHPLDGCKQNKEFMNDLKAWHKVAGKLCIWDYVTSFPHYLMPVPNYTVMAENIRILRQYGSFGIMEEGTHNAQWGEFSEMKAWILAKVLWNNTVDVNHLAESFIKDYYGNVAPAVLKYYTELNALIKENTHLSISWRNTDECNSTIYNDSFISMNIKRLEKALSYVKANPTKTKRLNRVLAQLYYLKSQRNKLESLSDGTMRKLKAIILQQPTYLNEQELTIENYEKLIGDT